MKSTREMVAAMVILVTGALVAVLLVKVMGQMAGMSDAVARLEARMALVPAAPAPLRRELSPQQRAFEQMAPLYQSVLATGAPRWLGAVTMQSPSGFLKRVS